MEADKTTSFDPGSFRDPAGRVFRKDGVLLRSVSPTYKETYDSLNSSGLFESLFESRLLISHEEVTVEGDSYKTIKPQLIPFISYPFEWCFSELKEAALLTLKIQKAAIRRGFTLKDSSAYNVQFLDNAPIFIDTLSFKPYTEGAPWDGYKQFCQHFLAPLALMSRRDIRLQTLLRSYIDGIPLDLASALLPLSSYLSPSLLFHIHLHARTQQRYADSGRGGGVKAMSVSRNAILGVLDNLEGFISRLNWSPKGTEWADYYADTNYSELGLEEKSKIIASFLGEIRSKTIWDIGANSGYFSKIAQQFSKQVISFDMDPAATERHYRQVKGKPGPFPLVLDLTNPTSSYGWNSNERSSFIGRGPADTVLALALVHHLAISNNVPLGMIARFMRQICKNLVIEFVPKEDSQVKRLLASREDIFSEYTQKGFEWAFSQYFQIQKAEAVKTSLRILYLMRAI